MAYKYLASPYSHEDPAVMTHRARYAMDAVAWLLVHRIWAYSPIVHCHDLARVHKMPKDFEFWQDYNFAMIERAEELLVLEIDGWKESNGIKGEMAFALLKLLPVRFLRPRPDVFPTAYEFHTQS